MPLSITFDYNFNEIPPLMDGCHKSSVKLTSYMQNDKRRVSAAQARNSSAVEVRRLRYVVGRRSKPKIILSGINMTVPEGAIYGLLGPSGSGKTTLLKSVVGQLTPSEGWVKVFGFQPNQPGSQIPGSAIGYMPQELAVYEDFTIKETLWYFGRLYKVPNKVIKERIEFLLTFLDLPRSKRLVVNMSGGQKRRVSLASALVHSPPLLILDEPTVGVDPLLRQSIWQHLVTLTQTEKITVIVTTHYIEEASRANIVGLMRRGKLLAESTPEDLMAKHDSTTLEDVFLKLCVTDTMRRSQNFASLTGNPVSMQAAIMGANSAMPTPEIGSKQRHYVSETVLDGPGSAHSGASQSPDEGVNMNHSSGSEGDSSSGKESKKQQQESSHMSNSPNNRSSVGLEAESTPETSQVLAKATGPHQQQPPTQTAAGKRSRFQLKSLFKFNSADSRAESRSDKKDAEKRRQSGSHYIEQLMNRYQQEQQLQNGANLQASEACSVEEPAGGQTHKPVNQLLSCDTTTGMTNHQQDQQLSLGIPKISVYANPDSYNSNSSSRSYSPIQASRVGLVEPASHKFSANNVSYNNHSYQPSDCGSVCNSLAIISSSVAGANFGPPSLTSKPAPADTTVATNQVDHLHKEVLLDQELFMGSRELAEMWPGKKYGYKKQSVKEYCNTIGTISWKNYIRLKRNVPLLLFQFVLPAIQVILFCVCVGNDPFDIPVAIVNEESSADSMAAMSTQFLHALNEKLVRQVHYDSLDAAIESVRDGKNWGVVHIPENFTISIHRRFSGFEAELDMDTLENSTIKVYPDMTNQPIGHAMEVAFRQAYSRLSRNTFDFLGLNPALSDPPIRMEAAIYGKIDVQNYLQYMSPGVLISISYIMATGLTSMAFIIERRDGLYDRTLAAGVDQVQMLISHSIVQLVVMIVQISLVVFFTFVIYKVPTNGPFVWVFLLLLLQGMAGMSFGLMVSSICSEENTAIMMILGTFYPNLLMAGVIWPIEAIPHWLRWFSYLQPQTLPTQSLRDLIIRGWDITRPGVYTGFMVTSIWLVVFLLISCIAFKIKK